MPKVLVLKVRGRHVERYFCHFLAKFWPEKITSRDGCFLPILVLRRFLAPALEKGAATQVT